jgi:hypothetical protein
MLIGNSGGKLTGSSLPIREVYTPSPSKVVTFKKMIITV